MVFYIMYSVHYEGCKRELSQTASVCINLRLIKLAQLALRRIGRVSLLGLGGGANFTDTDSGG